MPGQNNPFGQMWTQPARFVPPWTDVVKWGLPWKPEDMESAISADLFRINPGRKIIINYPGLSTTITWRPPGIIPFRPGENPGSFYPTFLSAERGDHPID